MWFNKIKIFLTTMPYWSRGHHRKNTGLNIIIIIIIITVIVCASVRASVCASDLSELGERLEGLGI
jgi:hypothetical protein